MDRNTVLSLTIALTVWIAGSKAQDLTMESLAENIRKIEQQGLMQAELIHKQNAEIEHLHTVVEEYKTRLHQQKTINEEYARRLKNLEKAVIAKDTDETEFKEDEDYGDELDTNEQATPERAKNKIRLWRSTDEGVAFHAVFKDADPTPTILADGTIVFPDVIMNIGYSYNNGSFVAPTDGIYLLSVSVACLYDTEAYIYIMKNDNILAGAFGDDIENYDQGSVTVTTLLAKNDIVRAKLTTASHNAVFGRSYTSFTGSLVFPL